jgi:ABC-type Fe3+ transport system permease subunit
MLLRYTTLATKRYCQYRWQKRKESFNKSLMAALLQLLQVVIKFLQQARIMKRRTVEKVRVD